MFFKKTGAFDVLIKSPCFHACGLFFYLSVVVHSPVYTSLQIFNVFRILTHTFAWIIRYLSNIHSVTLCRFHNDIKCWNLRIITDIRSYSKCYLCPAIKISIQLVSPVKSRLSLNNRVLFLASIPRLS